MQTKELKKVMRQLKTYKLRVEEVPEEFSNNMKEIGLEVPQVTELGYLLKQSGLNIEDGILSVEELIKEIEKVKQVETIQEV